MELENLVVRIEADAKPLLGTLDTIGRSSDRTLKSLSTIGDRMAGSFASAAVKGESLSSVLRGLAQDLSALVLRETVTKPLGGFITGALGALFGRAGGGSVSAGQPYVVGERGPELFVPQSAGRIDNTGGGKSAAPVVSISIDARGAEVGAADRLRAAAGEIEARTFAAVFAAMERGGRYARISGRR